MLIHEYGDKNKPVLLLLPPMYVNGTDLFSWFYPEFGDAYYYIYPDVSGTGEDKGEFEDSDKEASYLIAYLKKEGLTHLHLLYGASLGVSIGIRLLHSEALTFDSVYFDGAPFLDKLPSFINTMITRSFLKGARRCRKSLKYRKKNNLHKIYGQKQGDLMTHNLLHYSDETIKKIVDACFQGNNLTVSEEFQKKMILDYGKKDPDYIYGKKSRAGLYPLVTVKVRQGYTHCGYMAYHNKEYIKEIRDYSERRNAI